MDLQVGDVLRIENNEQVPVSFNWSLLTQCHDSLYCAVVHL